MLRKEDPRSFDGAQCFAEMVVIGLLCGSLPSELHTRGKPHDHVEKACVDA